MKALTLTQPWATLVAIGAKKIETRGWRTNFRGPLAIHAAKVMPDYAREVCYQEPFKAILLQAGFTLDFSNRRLGFTDLPRGEVVATCRMAWVQLTEQLKEQRFTKPKEWAFGDYSDGRFAWGLEDVMRVDPPIPARGTQNLWEWEPPEGFEYTVTDPLFAELF